MNQQIIIQNQSRHLNTVQAFIRFISFLITFGVLSLFLLVPTAGLLEKSDFGLVLYFVLVAINVCLSSMVSRMFHVLPEWQRLVLLRLGKFIGVRGPGLFVIPPFIYSVAEIVDVRITTQQVEATATLTKDNVPTRVTAAIEFRVENPQRAVIDVKDYLSSVIWLATEALKNTIGGMDLKEFLSNRDQIALQLKQQIDKVASEYGIDVRAVRITDIDTPPELVEELAVIARARRASRAKQIQAEAEVMVAKKIAEASKILALQKGGFKLREIQNLAEISKEESTTIIVYPFNSNAGREIAQASVVMGKGKNSQRK